MSHFGRSGPPDIKDSYSLLVLNITFRTTADDLYPLFDRYGKVVDIFIPRDRRTGDSRGFAFVRYKYVDEAEKAIERLDGRNVDGRDIVVQFAKYGPNAEAIYKGRLTSEPPYSRGKYRRSHSPRHSSRRDHDDYRHRDYRRQSRSRDRHERYRYSEREREYRRRTPSRSISPTFSRSRSRSRIVVNDEQIKRSCSRSLDRILKSRLQIVVALVGVIPMESQMCLQFQYQCFVFWCWTYSMFKQFNCWMLCGAVETLLVAVVAMMMGWGHVFLDAGDAVVADKRESCTQFLLLILMLALKC